jgi:flagellar motor switch protein FliM
VSVPQTSSPLDLGRQNIATPQFHKLNTSTTEFRKLHGVHEAFARSLATALSTFLRTEIQVSLGEISLGTIGYLRRALPSASCLIMLRLHPRQESMVLQLDSRIVFSLLELLLGGKGDSEPAEHRELTDIECSLLEEIVRVVVRPLGEAWQPLLAVEFELESLGTDPSLIPCPDPRRKMIRIAFDLVLGEQTSNLNIAIPQVLFDMGESAAERQEPGPSTPPQTDFERNLAILENANVEVEVKLHGPKLEFKDLMELRAGAVLTFDYSLGKPIHAVVNGDVTLSDHIVSAGRKRAFQIDRLP